MAILSHAGFAPFTKSLFMLDGEGDGGSDIQFNKSTCYLFVFLNSFISLLSIFSYPPEVKTFWIKSPS